MNRKSQAALEFLTTYAWAFLVILVMIGALAYFGILRPTKLLPDRCNFGSEIACLDYSIQWGTDGTDGSILIRIKNSLGEPIQVTELTVSSETDTVLTCAAPTLNAIALPQLLGTDTTGDVEFTTCTLSNVGFVQGDKARFNIIMKYYSTRSSASYTKQVNGEIFATVT